MKSGQATPIPPGEFTVGRADDTYVHLDDASVSRRHAMIFNNNEGFFVEDLQSANGTAARGAYITRRTKIDFGDVIYIGSVPFRIDHEVEGETAAAPSAGLRTQNRAYMRRDTERLPPSGTIPHLEEPLSSEALSAPSVNPATDIDAGALNAITLREPQGPLIPQTSGNNHTKTEHPASSREAIPVPVPQNALQHQPATKPLPPMDFSQHDPSEESSQQYQRNQAPEQAPASNLSWEWLLLSFMSGLGAGLLLALYFAKVFIELGGKASSLP